MEQKDEVPNQETPPTINSTDPITLEPLDEIRRDELIFISRPDQTTAAFHAPNLLQFIQHEVNEGKSFYDVHLDVETKDSHEFVRFEFGQAIWEEQLIPNHIKFYDLFLTHLEAMRTREIFLKQLHTSDLYDRLRYFIHDLQTFRGEAKARLENTTAPFFMDEFYFSPDDVNFLLQFPTDSGRTFEEQLQQKFQNAAVVCSSHDLAPLLWAVFDIKKNFHKAPGFSNGYQSFVKQKKKAMKRK